MEREIITDTLESGIFSFSIETDGQKINPSYKVLLILIEKEINQIPEATIILSEGNTSQKPFEISESEDFVPGKKVIIKIEEGGKDTQIFKGIIISNAVKIKENGKNELIIKCCDEAVRMTIGRHSRYFANLKDNEIFTDLIGKYKELKSDVQATAYINKNLVQQQLSDWDFMLLRAEANAMLVNVNNGLIKISKPKTDAVEALTVTYGSTLLAFEAETDARTQLKNVSATSWNYSNQELFTAATSEAFGFNEFGNISGSDLAEVVNLSGLEIKHSGYHNEEELQPLVEGIMMRSRLAKIIGRAKILGTVEIKPGDMLMMEGVGDRYNGKAFVTAIKHEIFKDNWATNIQFGLDTKRYAFVNKSIEAPPAAGLVGAVQGLQIGVVIQIESDPDGEDRILVNVPIVGNNNEGIWTRVACLDAGKDRGFFFRPEIGDEVIVGFINDDPRDAVVLGMLNSSAKPAPFQSSNENNEKGFTTRSNMHFHFNDGTKTITIDTPAGNSITLDESEMKIEIKDQHSNIIKMDSTGIKLESPKNIEIKAGGSLILSAANSIDIKANVALKMEAGAVAELSSHASTKIKGSIVQIN